MVKLTKEMRDVIDKPHFIKFLATSSKAGNPNVVPMLFVRTIDEETLLIVNNFHNKTIRNIEENPRVALTVLDLDEYDGYQFKGTVEVHDKGEIFEDAVNWVKSTLAKKEVMESLAKWLYAPVKLATKSAIVMKVKEVYTVKPGPEPGKKLL